MKNKIQSTIIDEREILSRYISPVYTGKRPLADLDIVEVTKNNNKPFIELHLKIRRPLTKTEIKREICRAIISNQNKYKSNMMMAHEILIKIYDYCHYCYWCDCFEITKGSKEKRYKYIFEADNKYFLELGYEKRDMEGKSIKIPSNINSKEYAELIGSSFYREHAIDVQGFLVEIKDQLKERKDQYVIIDQMLQSNGVYINRTESVTAKRLAHTFNELVRIPNLIMLIAGNKGLSDKQKGKTDSITIIKNKQAITNIYPNTLGSSYIEAESILREQKVGMLIWRKMGRIRKNPLLKTAFKERMLQIIKRKFKETYPPETNLQSIPRFYKNPDFTPFARNPSLIRLIESSPKK